MALGHNRPVTSPASPPCILVVEDDLTVSEVVIRDLEREGFVVEVASTAPCVVTAGASGPWWRIWKTAW